MGAAGSRQQPPLPAVQPSCLCTWRALGFFLLNGALVSQLSLDRRAESGVSVCFVGTALSFF